MSDEAAWQQETAGTEAGWTHAAMRDAVRTARRVQREMDEDRYSEGGPTDVVLAGMLEHVLDEIALGEIEQQEGR